VRLLLVPILLCLAAGAAGAQGFELGLRRSFDFGPETRSPLVADLNGDGKQDVVVSNTVYDSLAVRLGDGFGNLAQPTYLITGTLPTTVRAGDLDGDGRPELVCANFGGNSISVFRNKGSGTFFPRVDYPVGLEAYGLAIGDVTGDGRPDVVVTVYGTDSVKVFTGSGTGTGLTGATQTMRTGPGPTAVELGDVDGDGLTDIVTANSHVATVSVLRGQTGGGFAPKVDYATATGPIQLRLGDVDSDGDLDLVTISPLPGRLSLLLNNGAGAFPFHDDLPVVDNVNGLVLADMTGDAIPDVAFSSGSSADITVLQGSGFSFFNPQAFPMAQGVGFSVTAGDLDNDGWRDLIATTQTGRIVVLYGARTPFGVHQDFAAGSNPRDVAAADLDGDTFPDIAAANNGSGNTSVLLNAKDGSFPAHTEYATPGYPTLVRFGDIDVDGHAELVVGTFSPFVSDTNRVYVLEGLAGGTFGPRRQFDPFVQDGIAGIALGRVDGDPYLDMVDTHFYTNAARIWLGDSTGGFTPVLPPIVTGAQPAGVQLVDLNVDGALDIIYPAFGTNNVQRLLGDGAGHFGTVASFPTAATGPLELARGDVDQDGKADFAVFHSTSHSITWLRGQDNGAFVASGTLSSTAANGLVFRDMNRDGIPDLVFGSNTGFAVRYGQGGGTFGEQVASDPVGERFGLVLEDLDRNGTFDAVTGLPPGSVAVLYGLQQTHTTLTVSPDPAPLGSQLTLTAVVTPIAPDSSDASGTVRFFDGLTLLGSAPAVNGVATLQHAASLKWNRSFRAEFLGDAHFHGSFSAPVPQLTYVPSVAVEGAPPLRLSLAPVRQPSSGGELGLRFTLTGSEAAELSVFDVRGRLIRSLAVGDLGAGAHAANLGHGLKPGVYLVRLAQGARAVTTRAVVL